jgi:hypothetical protein
MRRNLVLATKDSELYVVRFLKETARAEETLKAMLNLFITNHPERYFSNVQVATEHETNEKE